MELSMLATKKITRENLYYGEYKYRIEFSCTGLRWYRKKASKEAFLEKVDQMIEEISELSSKDYWDSLSDREKRLLRIRWGGNTSYFNDDNARRYVNSINLSRDFLEDIVDFHKRHRKSKVTFRTTYGSAATDKLIAYTNDLNLVEDSQKIHSNHKNAGVIIEEVTSVFPTGVKYFKKEPPAKMRVYFKNYCGNPELKEELSDFFSRTKEAKPSQALCESLSWPSKSMIRLWFFATHFFDCDDDSIVSYFALMFPQLIGKVYHLEKNPENL